MPKGVAIPEDIKLLMIQEYQGGLTSKQVGEKFGCGKPACSQVLRRKRIQRRPVLRKITPAQELELIDLYNSDSKLTLEDVGNHFGICWSSVRYFIRKHGFVCRPSGYSARKREVDQNFFKVIDTEEKAYWLGFIVADGCVYLNKRNTISRLTLHLSVRDKTHLEKFLASIKSNYPVSCNYGVFGNKMVRVDIGSKHLVDDLIFLGATPRKSFTAEPTKDIPSNLIRHYWRGIMDGDGCIHYGLSRNHKRIEWSVTLVGSKGIVGGFREYLLNAGLKSTASVRPTENIFKIHFHGNTNSDFIIDILYRDAGIFLDRKMFLAGLIMSSSCDALIVPPLIEKYKTLQPIFGEAV